MHCRSDCTYCQCFANILPILNKAFVFTNLHQLYPGFKLVKQNQFAKNLWAQHGKRPGAGKKCYWVCKSFYKKCDKF